MTVVMPWFLIRLMGLGSSLQWVHGRMTVVMRVKEFYRELGYTASMGPRSDDRGYASADRGRRRRCRGFNGSTVG